MQPLRRDDLPLLNYRAAYAASFGSTEGAVERPRILVVGCGTVEPVAIAAANPFAEILAVDLSARSLEKLRWQARWRGMSGRIRRLQADLEGIPRSEGRFDYVVATGVLHHLESPERALRALLARTYPRAVFRCMVYSRWGRDLLYGAKEMAMALGVRTPRQFRRLIGSLPANHPYRIYFHLYSDARTDTGLCDGYLHPCDQAHSALGWEKIFGMVGLEATHFLQRPEGQPAVADRLAKLPEGADLWDRMAVLEALGALEENFIFFARRADEAGLVVKEPTSFEWNPALRKRGAYQSKLVGEALEVDPDRHPCSLSEATRARLWKLSTFCRREALVDSWILDTPPAEFVELPSLCAEHGSARLAVAGAILGDEAAAKRTAEEAGLYLLDDKLALQLKLQGLKLGRGGEIPALSPARWTRVEAREIPADATGLFLDATQRRRFRNFLRGKPARPEGLVDFIRLARHFFYEESLRVGVATRPRV